MQSFYDEASIAKIILNSSLYTLSAENKKYQFLYPG